MSATDLNTKLRRLFEKACSDYQLVCPGDRIMVGLSGGKDSLTLVNFLAKLRDSQGGNFHIVTAHVKFTNLPYSVDIEYLEQFCAERNVEFHVVEDKIRDGHMESGMTCVHCSRFRRAKLMELSRVHRCNKLALGHHLDDIVATLLMNMSQHGRFAGMAVKLNITVGDMKYPLTLVRPLCLISENDIRSFVTEQGYKPERCRCEWGDSGFRSKARDVVDLLCERDENIRMNLFKAQFNISQKFLASGAAAAEPFDIEDLERYGAASACAQSTD